MPDNDGLWVERKHPFYDTWADDEERMRATYHARRRDLAPYLVPHRFESGAEGAAGRPQTLDRAELGYGISLNSSYLAEVFGQIRGAEASYHWGPLGGDTDDESGLPPIGSTARSLWEDATRENTSWRNFFHRDVLEWMLSSPGSLIVADVPPGRRAAQSDDATRRPYVRNVPLSDVWDMGRSPTGIRWVKLVERLDRREPDSDDNEISENVIIYRLEGGRTLVQRWTMDGDRIGPEIDMGAITDRQGDPALPVVLNAFGRHPDVRWVGEGLLTGLDDIVIDLFNVVSEMRAGYRDLVVALLTYAGNDAEGVFKAIKAGSRMIDLGDDDNARLERLAADSVEVDAGIAQLEQGIRAWARSAKRKASDFEETSQVRSGMSLEAEFQIDLVPLLREVAEQLDNVESSVMHRLAQLDDESVGADALQEIGVRRAREFDPEEEASRISRIVDEFRDGWSIVPAEAKAEVVQRWLESARIADLDQEVETADGSTVTLRELVADRAEELAEFSERSLRQRASLTGPLVRDTGEEAA